MNQNLYTYIHNFSNNTFIAKVAYFFSYPLAYVLPIILVILCTVKNKRPLYAFSLICLTSFLSWLSAFILKLLFHIPRPVSGSMYFDTGGYSFPSEHAAMYAALAFSIGALRPSWSIPMAVLALLVGLSRIILGVHTPLDILGGFAVGSLVSYIVIRQFKKI